MVLQIMILCGITSFMASQIHTHTRTHITIEDEGRAEHKILHLRFFLLNLS